MTTSTAPLPAYCSPSYVKPSTLDPAQIAQCFKLGYNWPTTGATHLGGMVGPGGVPVVVIVVVIALVLLTLKKLGGGSPAPQRS